MRISVAEGASQVTATTDHLVLLARWIEHEGPAHREESSTDGGTSNNADPTSCDRIYLDEQNIVRQRGECTSGSRVSTLRPRILVSTTVKHREDKRHTDHAYNSSNGRWDSKKFEMEYIR